jgi:hypothetical protein
VEVSGANVNKWKGLTEQKGEFLKLTEQEKENHLRRLSTAWDNILRA